MKNFDYLFNLCKIQKKMKIGLLLCCRLVSVGFNMFQNSELQPKYQQNVNQS